MRFFINFLVGNNSVFELYRFNSVIKPQWQQVPTDESTIEHEDKGGPFKNKYEITGRRPLTWSLPILGAKWQTVILFIISDGAFHLAMTFTGGPCSLSRTPLFSSILEKHARPSTPPTSYFIHTNIPDRFQRSVWQTMKILHELEAVEAAVSSPVNGYGGSSTDIFKII